MKGVIFTYALTYGGAACSLVNPFIGVLIYIAFAIIKPESMWYWSVPAGNYSRIVALALLAGWCLNGFGDWRFGKARTTVFAFIGFLAWSAVSAFFCNYPTSGWNFVESTAKVVLPFVVAASMIRTRKQVRQLAWVIVLSQGYVALELNNFYYGGFNRLHEFGFGGMDNNSNAIAMVCGTGVALFLAMTSMAWWKRAICLMAAVLMCHCVFFAFSRGGMLGLIICGAIGFWLVPKRPVHYAAFLVVLLVAFRLAGPQVVERFMTTFSDPQVRDASAQSRLDMWKICVEQMFANPLLGLGPNHFPLRAHEFGLTEFKSAHTLWLQVGAELGVVGLGFLLTFYGSCVLKLWRLTRQVEDPEEWDAVVARMVIAGLIGFAVSAQFVSLVGLELPYYVVLLGVGTLKIRSREGYLPKTAKEEDSEFVMDSEMVRLPMRGMPGTS